MEYVWFIWVGWNHHLFMSALAYYDLYIQEFAHGYSGQFRLCTSDVLGVRKVMCVRPKIYTPLSQPQHLGRVVLKWWVCVESYCHWQSSRCPPTCHARRFHLKLLHSQPSIVHDAEYSDRQPTESERWMDGPSLRDVPQTKTGRRSRNCQEGWYRPIDLFCTVNQVCLNW